MPDLSSAEYIKIRKFKVSCSTSYIAKNHNLTSDVNGQMIPRHATLSSSFFGVNLIHFKKIQLPA